MNWRGRGSGRSYKCAVYGKLTRNDHKYSTNLIKKSNLGNNTTHSTKRSSKTSNYSHRKTLLSAHNAANTTTTTTSLSAISVAVNYPIGNAPNASSHKTTTLKTVNSSSRTTSTSSSSSSLKLTSRSLLMVPVYMSTGQRWKCCCSRKWSIILRRI